MNDEERLTNLEEFNRLIMQWARRAEERMDELRVAQANSETKIAALADAQIRTEGVVAALGEQMKELAAAQAHTDQRLDALIDIVRGTHEGNSPNS
jgi:chromosome segregation ATPase